MKKISFRKICHWLHLWLGLISGIIVFIVAITGCIYAFEKELRSLVQSYQYVEVQGKPFLSPSELKEKIAPYVYKTPADSANTIYGVTYATPDKAAVLAYGHFENGYTIIFQNPYTGDYLNERVLKNDFFRFVLSGHRNLWLPYQIGHQIVGWGVLIFVVVLITGIVIWIPKQLKKKTIKAALKIKWKTKLYSKIHALHRVLGVYSVILALIIACTGLTWSFQWFANSYYAVISGGGELVSWKQVQSDTTLSVALPNLDDKLWEQSKLEYPIGKRGTFMFDFPFGEAGAYRICYNPDGDTYYKRHYRFFDRSNLKELEGGGLYGTTYELSTHADKLYRMTYDIHTGNIGGFIGRMLMFLVSLIIAGLPITGMIIWLKKMRKKKVKAS